MPISTTAKVGLVTLIGLILISLVIIWKSEIFLLNRGRQLVATFENIEGLTIGSEVRYRGSKVGKVMRIDAGPYDIKIFSIIEPGIKIPADSSLRVAYDGIVGLKFMEIRPGTAEAMYAPPQILQGTRTAAIVDFIDIGSKNLVETKAILETVRKIIENPGLQNAFINAVYTAEKTANEAEKLTLELREATRGIGNITTDPKFQENVKGTIGETAKTLSSANRFFEGAAKLNLRASGGVDVGSRANAVRGDVDIIQSEKTYYRLGFGEGPSRQMSVLDFLFSNRMNDSVGFRLGVINSQLGGGLFLRTSQRVNLLADVYDINNATVIAGRLWPKLRLGYNYEMQDYMDFLLQADDLLNSGTYNVLFGIRVKAIGEKLY